MIRFFFCFTILLFTTDMVQSTCNKCEYRFNQDLPGWLTVHKVPATWEEAFLRCHFEGAILASPVDDKTTDILQKLIAESNLGQRFFIGIHSLFSDGVPLTNIPIRFRVPKRGQDEGLKKPDACLTMDIDGRTHYVQTSPCTNRYPYICLKRMYNETLKSRCGTFDTRYHYNEHTGSCYKLHRDYQTWSRANMICSAEGGYLVILNDEYEANFVKELFPNDNQNQWQPMSVGLRAWSKDRVWITNHGENLENVYNKWASNQPDNENNEQYCASLIRDGGLDDKSCETKAIFVCEKDPKRIMFELINE